MKVIGLNGTVIWHTEKVRPGTHTWGMGPRTLHLAPIGGTRDLTWDPRPGTFTWDPGPISGTWDPRPLPETLYLGLITETLYVGLYS